MTKEQQEILEQDRKETQEYIDSKLKEGREWHINEVLKQRKKEELDNIPVGEDLISDEELQEMQDSLDILLEQYTSNLDEIEKYKDILRYDIKSHINGEACNLYITSQLVLDSIKLLLKQLNKENKILLEEIKSLEFDINYCTNN